MSGTSPRNVWAVGATNGLAPADTPSAGFAGAGSVAEPLILHWNGAAWRQTSIPVPASGGVLIGIYATSGNDAWAVGCTRTFGSIKARPLVLHWNGGAWK
jgi:hypothetical protein